jgi:hypothetical protein
MKGTDEGGVAMRNAKARAKAREKAAGSRGGATNSTLAGVSLAVPRSRRRTGQTK